MGLRKDTQPTDHTHSEFDVKIFVDSYEDIADTFIDTAGAADSLKKQVPPTSKIFELGLGTGYFAQFLQKDGYDVSGIQPPDGMLERLKRDHPTLKVMGEAYIQDYDFTQQYDVIVSHSSVFLITKPDDELAQKINTNLIFQSFILDEAVIFDNIDKIMNALRPNGKLVINIQPNAHRSAQVYDDLFFEMSECEYDFDSARVRKVFGMTVNGVTTIFPADNSYVLKWETFEAKLKDKGYQVRIFDDGYWAEVTKAKV